MQKLPNHVQVHKVFGYFLKKVGVFSKFRKTKYGYSTFDRVWRLFLDTLTITQTKSIKLFNGYDYDTRSEESKYMIVNDDGVIKIKFVLRKVY